MKSQFHCFLVTIKRNVGNWGEVRLQRGLTTLSLSLEIIEILQNYKKMLLR